MDDFNILSTINKTIENIFDCYFQESISDVIGIVDYIERNRVFDSIENKETWQQILQYLDLGLQNKDYLVIADILKYELKPLLDEGVSSGGKLI